MASITFQQSNGTEVRIKLVAATITFGKGEDNDIILEDPSISSRHGELSFKDGSFYITDLGSTNGTLVNDEEISSHRLQAGDRIEIGTLKGIFADDTARKSESKPDAEPERESSRDRPAPKIGRSADKAQATRQKAPVVGAAAKVPSLPGRKTKTTRSSALPNFQATTNPREQQEGIGFHLFLMQFLIIVVAVVALSVRHSIETGGFFPADAFNAIRFIEKEGPVYDSEGNLVEDASGAEDE